MDDSTKEALGFVKTTPLIETNLHAAQTQSKVYISTVKPKSIRKQFEKSQSKKISSQEIKSALRLQMPIAKASQLFGGSSVEAGIDAEF